MSSFSDATNRKIVNAVGTVFFAGLFFFLAYKLAFLESIWTFVVAGLGTAFAFILIEKLINFFSKITGE